MILAVVALQGLIKNLHTLIWDFVFLYVRLSLPDIHSEYEFHDMRPNQLVV